MNVEAFEFVLGPIPGPRSRALTARLQRHESRNVTYVTADVPIVWERASGATVTDVDGNRYLDFTSAFGVAALGHANPRVASAIADQAARLAHGMGDVHPTQVRVQLLERLAAVLPQELDTLFLASTGSEAVEAALKTALLATGRRRFAAFSGAYHGLSLGALAVGGIEKFRAPFAGALAPLAMALPFPDAAVTDADAAIAAVRDALLQAGDVAAIVVEPIQGRAGCIVPPDGFLRALQQLSAQIGALLIVDEIYTGFGRTGTWFAIERDGIVPDLLCVGKALGAGFPIAALAGRRALMDAWPPSPGEALHTSTFLGNPMGCAAALASLDELQRVDAPRCAARLAGRAHERLRVIAETQPEMHVRGRGLFWGLCAGDGTRAQRIAVNALQRGLIVLQSGGAGDVLTIAPPLTIEPAQLDRGFDLLEAAVAASA